MVVAFEAPGSSVLSLRLDKAQTRQLAKISDRIIKLTVVRMQITLFGLMA